MDKVLVIDDERPTLVMFRMILNAYGYTVFTAENGKEGLAVFERERPPLVLTDIKMPGMDGIEVLKRIKEIDPKTEVIVMTGHGDMDLAIKALNLDATDFINKPIRRDVLEHALKHAGERRCLALDEVHEIHVEPMERAAVIHLEGSLTSHSEAHLLDAYREAAALKKARIVLHFRQSATINGAGIDLLSQFLLEANRQGHDVVIAGLSDNFKKVLEIVGTSRMVTMFDSLEEALP
jgi:anti-anti-sigma factor